MGAIYIKHYCTSECVVRFVLVLCEAYIQYASSWHDRPMLLVNNLCRSKARLSPDFVIMSCGLWHMLHITDAPDFAGTMQRLRAHATALAAPRPQVRSASVLCFIMWSNIRSCASQGMHTYVKLPKKIRYNAVHSSCSVPSSLFFSDELTMQWVCCIMQPIICGM